MLAATSNLRTSLITQHALGEDVVSGSAPEVVAGGRSWRDLAKGVGSYVKDHLGSIALVTGAVVTGAGVSELIVFGVQATFATAFDRAATQGPLLAGAAMMLSGIDIVSSSAQSARRSITQGAQSTSQTPPSTPPRRSRSNSEVSQSDTPPMGPRITPSEGQIELSCPIGSAVPSPLVLNEEVDLDTWPALRRDIQHWTRDFREAPAADKVDEVYAVFKYKLLITTHVMVLGCLTGISDPLVNDIALVAAAALAGPWGLYILGEVEHGAVSFYEKCRAYLASRAQGVEGAHGPDVEQANQVAVERANLLDRIADCIEAYKFQMLVAVFGSVAIAVFEQPAVLLAFGKVEGVAHALFQLGVGSVARPFFGPGLYALTHMRQTSLLTAGAIILYQYGASQVDESVAFAVKSTACVALGTILGMEDGAYTHNEVPAVPVIPKTVYRTPLSELPICSIPGRLICRGLRDHLGTIGLLSSIPIWATPQNFNGAIAITAALGTYHLRAWKPEGDLALFLDKARWSLFAAGSLISFNGTVNGLDPIGVTGTSMIAMSFGIMQYQIEAAQLSRASIIPSHVF